MDKKEKTKGQSNIFLVLLIVLMTVAVVVAIAGAIAGNLSETKPKNNDLPAETTEDTATLRENRVDDKEKDTADDTEDSMKEEVPEDTTAAEEDDADKKADAFAPEQTIPQFIAPAEGKVLKAYSSEVPVFSLTMEDYRTHSGVDIYADPKSTVIAAADGTVQEIWSDPMMGNCISIAHAGGALTVYKNLSDEFPDGIEPGKEVHAGDVIAAVGDSALEEISEESHLHFEMSIDGIPVDPAMYVKFMNEESYTE